MLYLYYINSLTACVTATQFTMSKYSVTDMKIAKSTRLVIFHLLKIVFSNDHAPLMDNLCLI